MSYQRPHISLGPGGELVGVFWSPPFEGPLRAPREEIGAYYAAYAALHGAIERAPCTRHRPTSLAASACSSWDLALESWGSASRGWGRGAWS